MKAFFDANILIYAATSDAKSNGPPTVWAAAATPAFRC